jgi:hypothetical protein
VKSAFNGTSVDWIISFAVKFSLIEALEVKVKVKFTLEQVRKALRGR